MLRFGYVPKTLFKSSKFQLLLNFYKLNSKWQFVKNQKLFLGMRGGGVAHRCLGPLCIRNLVLINCFIYSLFSLLFFLFSYLLHFMPNILFYILLSFLSSSFFCLFLLFFFRQVKSPNVNLCFFLY